MWYKYLAILLVISITLGCMENVTNTEEGENNLEMRISRENIPDGITSIVGNLEREDYETQTINFDMTTDPVVGIFEAVSVGEWHLSVSAFSAEILSYFGETDLMVNPGQNFVSLTLNPHNGSLIVEIIWNTPEQEDDYIIAYTHNSESKNIFSYDMENSILEQLTENNYSTHPFYKQSEDKIYYLSGNETSLFRMDFNGENQEYVGSFSHSALFPVYCESTDLYYYYYINIY